MIHKTIPEILYAICDKYKSNKNLILYKTGESYQGIDYSEFLDRVECFALGLIELGLHKNDRIGIISENRLEWIISDMAIASIGAVSVPIFPTLTPKQEEYIYNNCEATAIIVSTKYQLNKIQEVSDGIPSLRHIIVMNDDAESSSVTVKTMDYIMKRGSCLKTPEERTALVREAAARIDTEDLLTIIYTSGTTGNPKGVMLSHKNETSNVYAVTKAIDIHESDILLSYLPLCHSYERTVYLSLFASGSTIALAQSVDTVASNIAEIRPTLVTTVPKLLEVVRKRVFAAMEKESPLKRKIFFKAIEVAKKWLRAKKSGGVSVLLSAEYKIGEKLVYKKLQNRFGGRLRYFVSGGAPLNTDVSEFFHSVGIEVLEGYGLTEASPVVSVSDYRDIEIGTIGKPMVNVEVKIVEDGEILVKAPSVMKGYWNDPIATNEAIDEEGWLYTGDIGHWTAKGNIKITDRKKNLIVSSGGKNIAPQPIENLLMQSAYIEHCLLIGDKREYCVALIQPDFDQLKQLADTFGIPYKTQSELISNSKIIATIKGDIDRLQKDLAKYERVRKFSLITQPFSVENGELTPKLSIKRHVVERKYSDLIANMYGMD